MKRLLLYVLAVILGAITGFFIWVWPGAWPGLTALGLALVTGLCWIAQRFPKPRFTGGTDTRILYVIAGGAALVAIGAGFLLPVYGHYPCPVPPQGICEFNTYFNMTRIWVILGGGVGAFFALLAGLMASAHK